ncbi:MAG: UDP-N-acetylmuramate dehydrogenase [Cellvibrionaceae bacterium]
MVKLDLFTNHSLQELNTLAVPAIAGNFVVVTSIEELKQAISLAAELDLKTLVLGGGSNVILPDFFPGLVIKIGIKGFELIEEDEQNIWVRVGAGEEWQDFIDYCLNFHYWGIENLSLIPGTVGAAPIQNIGAYGVELKDFMTELTAVEIRSLVDVTFQNSSCEFGYRDSVFKNRFKDQYIITHVTFKLLKTPCVTIEYPTLKNAIANRELNEITPQVVSQIVCEIRRSKLPDPDVIPNAGSFFKNPIVDSSIFREIQKNYPDVVSFPLKRGKVKLAAGWLLEQAGWKGVNQYGVGIHEDQALVLTNEGRKAGEQIVRFAEEIRTDILQRFGVVLEFEPANYSS